jgi:hypothetical protein
VWSGALTDAAKTEKKARGSNDVQADEAPESWTMILGSGNECQPVNIKEHVVVFDIRLSQGEWNQRWRLGE